MDGEKVGHMPFFCGSVAAFVAKLDGQATVRDENGQLLSMAVRVRRELITKGIVWHDGQDYRIRARDYERLSAEPWSEHHVCDFCMMRPVEWEAVCDSFHHPDGYSVGNWATCDPCGRYILDGNKRGLIERWVNMAIGRAAATTRVQPLRVSGRARLEIEASVKPLFDGFWRAYKSIHKVKK